MAAATAKRSSYGTSNRSSTSGAAKEGSKTTHYGYTLVRDEDGNISGKEYVDNIQVYENQGKFGPFLKVRVTGAIPVGDIFIVKKKDAQ